MDQAPHETQATNETPVNEGQRSTETLTPFGSRLNPASASFLAQNRLAWHLQYWRDLEFWGVWRDVDPVLMGILIEMEQLLKLGPQLRREIRQAQAEHRSIIYGETTWWYNKADRDIDRVLANKGHKTRAYLRGMERFMLLSMRAGDTDTAATFLRQLTDLYRRLRAQEEKDAERRFSFEIPKWR